MKRLLVILGTRPEAIKLCPLIKVLKERKCVQTMVCATGQHSGMTDEVLDFFGIAPDWRLSVMRAGQPLEALTARLLTELTAVFSDAKSDSVLVQGDTVTAFAGALTGFYQKLPVAHVEAGLRSGRLDAPFPEEMIRRTITMLAYWHFAPTEQARAHLLYEGVLPERVWVTGNTGIDALRYSLCQPCCLTEAAWAGNGLLILLTVHRRENMGVPIEHIFRAIRRVTEENPSVKIICPLHPNELIRKMAEIILGGHPRILLTEPLKLPDFHQLLAKCYLVVTDSGGIQEEATYLGKPVLVVREITERSEGVSAGGLTVTGIEEGAIYTALCRLLTDQTLYRRMSSGNCPYGSGNAARRIADILCGQMENGNVQLKSKELYSIGEHAKNAFK